VPNKNLQDLGGHPLIYWTIKHAQDFLSGRNTEIYVSSDDPEILEYATNCGVGAITRPSRMCTDTSPSEEAIYHALNESWVGRSGIGDPDIIVMLQCTSPFRGNGQAQRGVRQLMVSKADSLFFGWPLGRWVWSTDPVAQPLNYDLDNRPMTQEKEGHWEMLECGDYVFTLDSLRKHDNRLGGNIQCCEVTNSLYATDIDTVQDLRVARALVKEFNLAP